MALLVASLAPTISIYGPSELGSLTPFTMIAEKWVLLRHYSSRLKTDI